MKVVEIIVMVILLSVGKEILKKRFPAAGNIIYCGFWFILLRETSFTTGFDSSCCGKRHLLQVLRFPAAGREKIRISFPATKQGKYLTRRF